MEKYKVYTFTKDYTCELGTIQKDGELSIVNGVIYYNGGLLSPDMQVFFKKFIDDDAKKTEYLKESNVVYNKV